MAEVYPTAIEDVQPVGLGRKDSKSSNAIHNVEPAKDVTEIDLLAANLDPQAQSRCVVLYSHPRVELDYLGIGCCGRWTSRSCRYWRLSTCSMRSTSESSATMKVSEAEERRGNLSNAKTGMSQ